MLRGRKMNGFLASIKLDKKKIETRQKNSYFEIVLEAMQLPEWKERLNMSIGDVRDLEYDDFIQLKTKLFDAAIKRNATENSTVTKIENQLKHGK